jgi:hypothetical protein
MDQTVKVAGSALPGSDKTSTFELELTHAKRAARGLDY